MARSAGKKGEGEDADERKPHGVQSAASAVKILRAFLTVDGPLPLAEIASKAGMAASNVYRYLVTFCESGLTVQDETSGFYDLGPLAAQLGFSALSRIDGVGLASTRLRELVAEVGADGHLSVWGSAGTTVVRWHARRDRISLLVREGTVLPVLTSATGRLWASYLPEPVVAPMLGRELLALASASGKSVASVRRQYEPVFAEIRDKKLSFSSGEQNRGIDALAAPIFDESGEIAFSLTLLGSAPSLSPDPTSPVAAALLAAAREISERLGQNEEFGEMRPRTLEPRHVRRGRPKAGAEPK